MGFFSRNNRQKQAAANIDQIDAATGPSSADDRIRQAALPPEERATSPELRQDCPHSALVPRWADANDMGKEDRISEYLCEACNSMLTPEQGRAAMEQEAQRIRI
jgi:hypothetical protein